MTFSKQSSVRLEPLGKISQRYLADEAALVAELAGRADAGPRVRAAVRKTAVDLVRVVRDRSAREGGLDAFMQQYDLSSQEGVLLMCVAEALLRIPDASTADRLIADKLTSARWEEHLGASESLFVNASTWGLMLTGQLLRIDPATVRNPAQMLKKIASSAGEPVVRTAMRQAMRIIGHQFVMGRNIDAALERAAQPANRAFRYSFDMLGEAALTAQDADRYFGAYQNAIRKAGAAAAGRSLHEAPGISVKLSALHPRYEFRQATRCLEELLPRLVELCDTARDAGVGLTVDAEESHRLELSLDLFERAIRHPKLDGYHGLGLAIQAYQRRAIDVVDHIVALGGAVGRSIPVRLVKGAYWDSEIKLAQEQGLESYPVFTRKAHTDVSYLACARRLLAAGESVYPQFATHNAHTLASIMQFAGDQQYEFQRLHGMGEELYADVIDPDRYGKACRVYAPVGSHRDLLPYLVRRLLENGANTSFVNRILDDEVDIEDIVADPLDLASAGEYRPHRRIPDPPRLFGDRRINSRGHNLADRQALAALLGAIDDGDRSSTDARPAQDDSSPGNGFRSSTSPADSRLVVGSIKDATQGEVDSALESALGGQPAWDRRPAGDRAALLDAAADLYEMHSGELVALCCREAGRTVPDALQELREAVDFLRYYAAEARERFGTAVELPGPTGESNRLSHRGRGVFLCISPWNFPLAIFTGQVAAALVAGNCVLAKPAEQVSLVAARAVSLLQEAGIPRDVLHLLPGDGAKIGGYAASLPGIAGVAFTGSTETASAINRALAARGGAIPALIAETGGLNALFADSSALPEQVVLDTLLSAFNSAGQRCSALRVLFVQKDIANRVIDLLIGAMDELVVGDPADLGTDVGPVIDGAARDGLNEYIDNARSAGKVLYQCSLPASCRHGSYVAPVAIELTDVDELKREIFGPVLHVHRFRARDLGRMIDAMNDTGYGLTMGLHSRIDSRAAEFVRRSRAGNIYINRNLVGAVVGVQPFGGRGLSGTGPKAGGPGYLSRFATEVTVSNNVAAVGGNAALLSLDD